MPQHHTKRIVPHSAQEMFDLVSDVEKYPRFVPLCENLRVRKHDEREGKKVLLADMTVAYALFRDTFTSRVTMDEENLAILVEYITGPFASLQNRWSFTPLEEKSCEVDFFIQWEMKSRTLALVVGAVFERAFLKFADAFEARANLVYNRPQLADASAK